MKETPKEIFLKEISQAVYDFECVTGVQVHNIALDRIDNRDHGDIGEESLITQIKLDLK